MAQGWQKISDLLEKIDKTKGFQTSHYAKGWKVTNLETKESAYIGEKRRANSSPTHHANVNTSLKRIGWTFELYEQQKEADREKRLNRSKAEELDMDAKALAEITKRVRADYQNPKAPIETPEPAKQEVPVARPAAPSAPPVAAKSNKTATGTEYDRIELLPFAGPIPPEVLSHVVDLPGELEGKTFYLDLIDSDKAKAYLDRNIKNNRNILEHHAKVIQSDMEEGTFPFTAAPILTDADGNVIDGQHRMTGAYRAGDNLHHPLWFLVATGITDEALTNVDRTATRTLVNVLTMHEINNAKHIAAIVRRIIAWERGHKWFVQSRTIITYDQMLERVMVDREMIEWASSGMARYARPVRNTNMNLNAFGVLLYVCAKATDTEISEEFWGKQFAKGLEIGEKHPAYALRRRLMRNTKTVDTAVGTSKTVEMTYNDHAAFGLVAWNNAMTTWHGSRLQSPSRGWTEEKFNEMEVEGI